MKVKLVALLLALSPFAYGEIAPFSTPLNVPPILEGTELADGSIELSLTAQRGTTSFIDGVLTDTMGYNGSYLGPTIRVKQGDKLKFNIDNQLGEDTTLHWHGLHVPAAMDGGPRQVIKAGTEWNPEFEIRQQAATLWYHPHLMDKTAEHVYNGLAGFFIIDDPYSAGFDLPNTYGVDDIPLVVQERRFDSEGTFSYSPAMPDVMHGYLGNALLVNGAIAPRLEVPRTLIRLRLLNGSNSSIHRFRFSDERSFSLIATDGGFLSNPVPLSEVILSPGERSEILLDLFEAGDSIDLIVDTYGGESYQSMRFIPVGTARARSVPKTLSATLTNIDRSSYSGVDRTFDMLSMGMGGGLTINGKRMNLRRIDEFVDKGKEEVWEIRNPSRGMMAIPHSFHVHDVQFRIISIDGEQPPEWQSGRKDTVLIWPGTTVSIVLTFEEYLGVYMYHCHLLEHEDAGMMGQIEVVEP